MNLKTIHLYSFLSLTMCTVAMILVYFWCTPSMSYLHSTKTEVSILLPATAEPWKTPAHNERYYRQGRSHTQEADTASNNAIMFSSHHVHRKNRVKVPPLPKTLPYAVYLRSVEDIQKASWTTKLYTFLESLDQSISPHVNMVFADSHHLDLVLNWIIAAHLRLNPPLHNIMVLSVDQPLCDFLASKKLPVTCITVPSESILASSRNVSYEQNIKTRFVILRVINFWGYDVASYDSDAVLLRNPQHLYDSNPHVQVFGGASFYPRLFADIWGFAVCGGTLIVRSHPSTENLWKYIHNSTNDECEQCLWNDAMVDLGVTWNVTTDRRKLCLLHSGWQSNGPLVSVVFPQKMFCRQCCRRMLLSHYYVVHPNNEHLDTSLKHQRLMGLRSWFIRENWRDFISSTLEGNLWLFSIYNS